MTDFFNFNEFRLGEPGIGKLADSSNQQFVIRMGVIDDPYFLKPDDYIKEKRHPLLGSSRDGEINGPDTLPKDRPENANFTTKINDTHGDFEAVNRNTRRVMVRWLDDWGGIGRKGSRETYNSPDGTQKKAFGRQERAFVSLTSPGFYASRRNDDGQGNGPYVRAGFEYMPPVGSLVLVGFKRGHEPYIHSYLGDVGTHFTPKTSEKSKLMGSTNSILQSGFDVDIDGPKSIDAFHPTIEPLNLGAIRLGSYGGSHFSADNHPENFTKRSRAQKADIGIYHTLGSFIKIHSDTIPDSENFPGTQVQQEAKNVNEASGTITLQHQSGSYLEIGDAGSVLMSDVQVQKHIDIFNWRPQDKNDNQLHNEDLIPIGEHRSLEDIRKDRLDPHGRGNMIFMDGRDKILIQDTSLDFMSFQNDNITARNASQSFFSLEGNKIILKNAAGCMFMMDDKQLSMKDGSGNHILMDGDTIQMGNSEGSTMRIGKDGVTYSNKTGSVASMNGDGIGFQTKTGAKIEKTADKITIVANELNLVAKTLNITTETTNMHSDKDTNAEAGNNINFKVANNENHEIKNNLNIKSTKTDIKSIREISLTAKQIRENS
jgi:hypothetical protein